MELACPCCGFKTIEDEMYGSYLICPICDWEDDQVQLANPCSKGGANGYSLAERQEKIMAKIPLKIEAYKNFRRCKSWRPLTQAEANFYQSQSQQKACSNKGITNVHSVYWYKNS